MPAAKLRHDRLYHFRARLARLRYLRQNRSKWHPDTRPTPPQLPFRFRREHPTPRSMHRATFSAEIAVPLQARNVRPQHSQKVIARLAPALQVAPANACAKFHARLVWQVNHGDLYSIFRFFHAGRSNLFQPVDKTAQIFPAFLVLFSVFFRFLSSALRLSQPPSRSLPFSPAAS